VISFTLLTILAIALLLLAIFASPSAPTAGELTRFELQLNQTSFHQRSLS